jgi:hypothetical protein
MSIGTQKKRAYASAHFVLELDGDHIAGFIRSVEGGGTKADILTYYSGASSAQNRQLGNPKYDDIKLQVGMSMSRAFYAWIAEFFSGKVVRKNGAILAGDFHYRERARRALYDTLLAEVSIPKFDGADRAPCYMGVTLSPERIRFEASQNQNLAPHVATSQKLWTANSFEFSIAGFEQATRRTTKIEGFTIKQTILEYRAGNLRDPVRVPTRVEFPNITFFIPEADAEPLIEHFTRRVIHGEPAPDTRLTGSITAQDSDSDPLCTISLFGIDIAAIGPDKSDTSSQDIKQTRVDITVESMGFQYHGSSSLL